MLVNWKVTLLSIGDRVLLIKVVFWHKDLLCVDMEYKTHLNLSTKTQLSDFNLISILSSVFTW